MVGTKGLKSILGKFQGIVGAEDFGSGGILGFDLSEETDECGKYLSTVLKEIDPTHTSVVVNKDNVVCVATDGGGTRRTPNVAMNEVERGGRGKLIPRWVGCPMVFT